MHYKLYINFFDSMYSMQCVFVPQVLFLNGHLFHLLLCDGQVKDTSQEALVTVYRRGYLKLVITKLSKPLHDVQCLSLLHMWVDTE